MKKSFKFSALLLSATILLSSCIGSFGLTNKVKDWNESLGNKFVNELVFVCMHIVPVYPIAIFADAVVLNSIEFWTGENPMAANVGETKIVTNTAGEDIQITTTENGYNLSNGEQEMQLVFDEAEKTWSAVYDNESVKLMQFTGDNSAQMFTINGNSMNVTLDEAGVNAARLLMLGSFAMK
ncbi:MAG: DUF3332 domain-containing protein [Bacteroidaceae bacterium]|nr:DUF3332 domain-containing protein [Bacteroidaceae bacterium]